MHSVSRMALLEACLKLGFQGFPALMSSVVSTSRSLAKDESIPIWKVALTVPNLICRIRAVVAFCRQGFRSSRSNGDSRAAWLIYAKPFQAVEYSLLIIINQTVDAPNS